MKKQYIKPQVAVCLVDTVAILAASDPKKYDSRPQSDVSGTSADDNQFSKSHNFNLWEDE